MKKEESVRIGNINTVKKAALAIKRIRKLKNISQEDLAKMVDMRQPTISDIEKGKGTLDSFFKIIQALTVDLEISTNKPQNLKASKINNKVQSALSMLTLTEEDE